MGTCGHSLIIRDLYMYNLKVYTSNINVVNYGDTVANHGSVYRPCTLELPKGGMGSTLF